VNPIKKTLLFLNLLVAGFAVLWLALAWLEHSYGDGENYSLIEDGLFMGGDAKRPPSGTKAVLNLCETDDGYRTEVYRWEAIADSSPAPSVEWLRHMVEFIDKQRQAGLVTYVHCRNGVSRSGMVITAYLMFKNHWSRGEALAFVRTKRPIVRPNPAFMERLAEWEHELHAQRPAT
jgi:hypothetical protein